MTIAVEERRAASAPPRAAASVERHGYQVDVMSRGDKLVYWSLVALWLGGNVLFWGWWFNEDHIVTLPGLIFNSLLIAYDLLLPGWFLFFLGRMREPNPAVPPPPGLRVAMVTTKVPGSEPWPVVEETLRAMLDQKGYPHDVWLLDEGGDPEVAAACAAMGVHYFTRKGIAKYQQPDWPFKSKTKAGNYNAWLDAIGYERYDVLVQMDTDHVPQPGYLVEMLRPFADPEIVYVAAPSICDRNEPLSWIARARVEAEAMVHGPVQAGYSSLGCPMIIGSHATFRTACLKAIGGFQRTLAEDHDNARVFATHGMRGAFAFRAIARGDGPATFADAMVQEYQWARAVVQILLNYFPSGARWMRPGAFAVFLFCETWYPFLAGVQFCGHLLPFLALTGGMSWVSVYLPDFMVRQGFLIGVMVAAIAWVRSRGWSRPHNAPVMSWRTVLFQWARWPWVLAACGEAVLGWLMRRDFNFKVTPKGQVEVRPLPFRFLAPYLLLLATCAAFAFAWNGDAQVSGYLYFVLVFALLYSLLIGAIVVRHLTEAGLKLRRALQFRPQLGAMTAVAMATSLMLTLRGPATVEAVVRPTGISLGDQPTLAVFFIPEPTAPGPSAAPLASAPAEPIPTRALSAPPDVPEPPAEAQVTPAIRPTLPDALAGTRIALGAYDPDHRLNGVDGITVEDAFVTWSPQGPAGFVQAVEEIQARGRTPIITLEPFPFTGLPGYSTRNLLREVAAGRYDRTLQEIGAAARANGQPIYLRWGHEMELCGLYPWSTCRPDEWIAAYRHVVDTLRATGADNLRYVWSPAGETTALQYWPGDEYVDTVAITVLIADEWAQWERTRPQPFATAMRDYVARFGRFGKPLIVAEFGVALATPEAAAAYLRDARRAIDEIPGLRGVIYFNTKQPPRSHGQTLPDWTLTPEAAAALFGPVEVGPSPATDRAAPATPHWSPTEAVTKRP